MSGARDRELAAVLLRLLLDGDSSGVSPDTHWDALLRLGVGNAVGIRAHDRLVAAGVAVPPRFAEAMEARRQHARGILGTMARLGELCRRRGVLFCYPKALLHLPDVGRDIDLLVRGESRELHRLLVRELGAECLSGGPAAKVSGSRQYRIPESEAVVDVHYGRLGIVGEHVQFPRDMLRRSRWIGIEGSCFPAPASDDQLALQGMQRVYGRTGIRLADVISTVTLLRDASLDWDQVLRVSLKMGTLPGLSCYLSYLQSIHSELLGRPLPGVPRGLVHPGWGRPAFAADRFRFPAVRVNCRLYLMRLMSDLVGRRWASVGRLGLLPAAALIAVGARAWRGLRRVTAPVPLLGRDERPGRGGRPSLAIDGHGAGDLRARRRRRIDLEMQEQPLRTG
jgi:hypothetical protein